MGTQRLITPEQFSTFQIGTTNLLDYVTYVANGSTGFGMPEIERIEDTLPGMDGAIEIGYRLLPRILKFNIRTKGATEAAYFQRRRTVLNLFAPDRDLQLKIATPDAPTVFYYLDCKVVSPALKLDERHGLVEDADIVLRAAQPCFYGAEEEWVHDMDALSFTGTITYLGSHPCPMTVKFSGPQTGALDDPRVTMGGVSVSLSVALSVGEYVLVDTGERTLRDQNGDEACHMFVPGQSCDLGYFRLPPRMSNLNSSNQITVTVTCADPGTSEDGEVAINWHPYYIGL